MLSVIIHANLYIYLCNRFQRVKFLYERSSRMPLLNGIPQGSGLGPLLFKIFLTNLFYLIEIYDLINYADDNTLNIIANTVKMVLDTLKHNIIINAIELFAKIIMEANPSKFQFMPMNYLPSTKVILQYIKISDVHIHYEKEINVLLLITN